MMPRKQSISVGLAHRLLAPRIAYIVTTVDKQNRVNAGPFSNLTSVSTDPECIVLGVYKPWDTIKNIRETGEFVVNVPSRKLLDEVWICGDKYAGNPIPRGVNELAIAGLTELPAEKVRPPRIAECFGHLECKVVWIKNVGNHDLVLGEVVAASFTKGMLDKNFIQIIPKTQPLFEIARGSFTFPEKVVEVDRKAVKGRVDAALQRMHVTVPERLKKYGRFSEE